MWAAAALRANKSILTFKVDFIELHKLYWVSNIQHLLICGLLDVSLWSYIQEFHFFLAKIKINK